MSDQNNNQTSNQTPESRSQEQVDNQVQQSNSPDNGQDQFGNQGVQDGYSYLGPHDISVEEPDAPDNYGDQDQFSDVDGQDPYNNLSNDDPGSTPGGEGLDDLDQTLYGLAEPLAKPGDQSRQGSDKDRYGTRISQDQQGYQQ